ncbi:hypothetical protein Nepgr_026423 [Nepenthes gracilis]|uniref:Uncharacterized protein n=1 Tax=Nepenthes gracilis TaxID=150966 RepID=A0AAD3T7U0_NEPGR|nr:hypothetical protein Nepgr_026423 [Nepenthes gracilis]
MRTKTSSSLADAFRAIVGGLLTLITLWSLWASLKSSPNPKPKTTAQSMPTTPRAAVDDSVNSLNCAGAAQGPNLRCDPLNPTFYDDPTFSYSIEKRMENWDEKRRQWLRYHPSFAVGLEERIIVVTGSQPSACPHPNGDHFMLRFFKNKVDYCRTHGYDIFYNNALLHPNMHGYWAKMQAVKSAMLAHPEAEWIFWVDSDAAFTDMDFKLPLKKYKDYNMVVHGWANLIYEDRSWVSVNAGVFLIRTPNGPWDFLSEWAKMGPQSPDFKEWGRIQRAALKDKEFPSSDDQSALVYLLLKEKEKWGDKVYIENEYSLHGYWIGIVGRLDNITEQYAKVETGVRRLRRRHAEKVSEHYGQLWEPYVESAGYGDDGWRRPFITHFTGCQPCTGKHSPIYEGDSCWEGMKRALNFADNQVLRNYGFMHPDLLESSVLSAGSRFYE